MATATASRLRPFDLPYLVEHIGSYMDTAEHCACSLVCRQWHAYFTPFVCLAVLADCDAVLRRLYKLRTAPSAKLHPNYRLEDEYIHILQAQVQKFDRHASSFHRCAQMRLACKSFVSFVLLGWLCENVREIHLSIRRPPSPPPDTKPETFKLSDEYLNTQQNPDRIMQVVERSRELVKLFLEDCLGLQLPFRWQMLADSAATAAVYQQIPGPLIADRPQWPKLESVTLKHCVIDGQFVRILLLNCPVLRKLWFTTVTFEFPPDLPESQRALFDFHDSQGQGAMDDGVEVDSVHPRHPLYPSVELLVFSRVSGLTIFQQMNFARQLPNLAQFLFIKSSMVDDRLDDLLPGFRSLQKFHLVQTNSNIQDTVNVDSSLRALTSNRLNDLAIEGVVIRNSLSLVIQRHSLHLTSLSIENCRISSDMEGADTLLHTLLQCCPSLKNFKCLSMDVRLCCDPVLFDQHVWTCTDLENLTLVPDCEPRNGLYTAVQAQEAFFSRIATLSQLKELSFAGCVGKRSFVVEDGLFLLRGMDKLEMVQLASSGLDDCVKLTEQHAEFMAREWPQLKVILGPYHMECRSFVAYLKSHRPDVRVSY